MTDMGWQRVENGIISQARVPSVVRVPKHKMRLRFVVQTGYDQSACAISEGGVP